MARELEGLIKDLDKAPVERQIFMNKIFDKVGSPGSRVYNHSKMLDVGDYILPPTRESPASSIQHKVLLQS